MREPYHTGSTFTKEQWIAILQDSSVTNPKNIQLLQTLYAFEGHQSHASQIGRLLEHKGTNPASPINLMMGNWGKKVVKKHPHRLTRRGDGTERKWDLFFDGWQDKKYFIWKIKDELKQAIEELGLTGERCFSEEIPPARHAGLIEGAKKVVIVNSYERNGRAREVCINHYGLNCQVCNFDFEKVYGQIGKNFIHVHHLTKLSEMGESYEVDPIKHLRPVCPNCHAMLHRKEPPFTVEELRELLIK